MQKQRRLARPVTDLKIRTSSLSPEIRRYFPYTKRRLWCKICTGIFRGNSMRDYIECGVIQIDFRTLQYVVVLELKRVLAPLAL